jgi:hypothetical protein
MNQWDENQNLPKNALSSRFLYAKIRLKVRLHKVCYMARAAWGHNEGERAMRDLLELLASECRCEYLSDLPMVYRERLTPHFVRAIPEDVYPLKDWQEAIRYLSEENPDCANVDAAREFLLRQLEDK